MAAVAGIAAFAPYLPLVVMGGATLLVMTRPNAVTPPKEEPSKEAKLKDAHMQGMMQNGVPVANWDALNNKTLLMGSTMNQEIIFDVKGGGYNPDKTVNPLDQMYDDNQALVAFDRSDTVLGLYAADGEVRMKRQNAIVSTLTAELYDPRRPEKTTTFMASRRIPAYPTQAGITQAKRNIDPELEATQTAQKYYGREFLNRAAGQSFRYGEE